MGTKMIVKQFKIFFDHPYATYYAGQMLTGKLVAKIISPTRIRGISLTFRGEAKVQWEESKTERDSKGKEHTTMEEFSANELYFENHIYILGAPTCDMLLQPGEHMYPFSMQLPAVLPSSFEGKHGHVRYTLTATMECVGQKNHRTKVSFSVLSQLDLNRVLAVKKPVQVVEDKFLCCCCCKSGPITAVVTLPATGFVPGQFIPLTIEVDNNSNKVLSTVICSLQKLVVFTAVRPSKKSRAETEKISQLVLGGVSANDSCAWSERINVPSLPPSVLQHCSIIDITYCLIVEVKIPGMHNNLSISVPITIGTIPLYSNVPRPMAAAAAPSAPHEPAELSPPSYEECTFGRKTGAAASAEGGFLPRYPMYHF